MERMKKSTRATANANKKMTREQMQLAIIKKKECEAKALKIVEQMLEPIIDSAWLIENLQHINRCHMEDVIEERAITRICGYVLCPKPLTVVIKQQYHISLKDKKVYEVSKRKNFCSSDCFGASNYLLEQTLTSPLWMRDREEIPNFQIFTKKVLVKNDRHGTEMDISQINDSENDMKNNNKIEDNSKENLVSKQNKNQTIKREEDTKQEINEIVSIDSMINSPENITQLEYEGDKINLASEKEGGNASIKVNYSHSKEIINLSQKSNTDQHTIFHATNEDEEEEVLEQINYPVATPEKNQDTLEKTDSDDDIIEQHSYFIQNSNKTSSDADFNRTCEKLTLKVNDVVEEKTKKDTKENLLSLDSDCSLKNNLDAANELDLHLNKNKKDLELISVFHSEGDQKEKLEKKKTKMIKKKKLVERKILDYNLAARVEKSFQEWVTEETIEFLYGDDSIKQRAIEKIEHQDRYSILCQKLNRLQFQDEQEDAAVLEKPVLKPAPHFSVLKEESEKLDIKVQAFYQGKTTFEEPQKLKDDQDNPIVDTFLPLTDVHAPQILRRKILLERLDYVLPDLLRTLAGNNEVYTRACCNYTSVRCAAVKALVQTFSLSANNIIFKTAEWTLVGLVIIKMLSILDPWLANLLVTKQANMYISMILTSYKLDVDYLNLLVASFNPRINPR